MASAFQSLVGTDLRCERIDRLANASCKLSGSFSALIMKHLFALFLAIVSLGLPAFAAGSDDADRTAAAYMLALGRLPAMDDAAHLSTPAKGSIEDTQAALRKALQADQRLYREVIQASYRDAFGRQATGDEIKRLTGDPKTYTDLMRQHLQTLADNAAAYEDVMHRAYQLVIDRDVYPEEIAYWKKQGTVPFALLAGAVEDWARRNQPGLMVTAGTAAISVNSVYLTTLQLSPAIAAEARRAAGLENSGKPRAEKHNIIAVGAEPLMSEGGIHFVAVGAPTLVK